MKACAENENVRFLAIEICVCSWKYVLIILSAVDLHTLLSFSFLSYSLRIIKFKTTIIFFSLYSNVIVFRPEEIIPIKLPIILFLDTRKICLLFLLIFLYYSSLFYLLFHWRSVYNWKIQHKILKMSKKLYYLSLIIVL